MRLNKYEKEWIARLMSGKSVKHKTKLFGPNKNSNCCLGVAARVCNDAGLCEINQNPYASDLHDVDEIVNKKIRVKFNGVIDTTKINKKWLSYFIKHDYIYTSLVDLNDETNMTHKEIGQFINENRKAVFHV